MESREVIQCTECFNTASLRARCEACHYSGWMTPDKRPATVWFGETERWKKKIAKEEAKRLKGEKKKSRFNIKY